MKSSDTVTVGWIDPGLVDGQFAARMIDLYSARSARLRGYARVEGGLISRQRNELVKVFLDDGDSDWLLILDSDEQLSIEAFDKLVATAHAAERPVVAGLYFGTRPGNLIPEPIPHLYRRDGDGVSVVPLVEYPPNRVIDVDAAGTGCLLIHRSVLAKFREHAEPNEGADWCWFRDLPIGGKWLGEDLYFCRRIKALGFPIVAHTGAILPHRRRFWLDQRLHEAARSMGGDDGH